jgi:hypothetical protein
MNVKMIAIISVIVLAVGGGSFYGGMKYEQSQSPAAKFANRANGGFQQGNTSSTRSGSSRVNGGGMAIGEIISKDATGITIKLRTGGSKIILMSGSTEMTKQTEGTADDLATGKQVSVTGTANSDGSISAQSIQIMSSSTMPTIPGGSGTQPPAGK